jgi:predicted transcriptional regulator
VGVGEKRMKERADIIANVSKVIEKDSVFFVKNTSRTNISGIPIIRIQEIKKIRTPFDILQLIKERE